MIHGAYTQEKQGEKWTACVLGRTGFERNGESKDQDPQTSHGAVLTFRGSIPKS